MAKFINDTSFVIARNEAVDRFCRVNPDGSHTILDFSASMNLKERKPMLVELTEQERAKLWNILELERWEMQQTVNALPTKGNIERLERIKELQQKFLSK